MQESIKITKDTSVVSVLVVTYNPQLSKLYKTLESILQQKDIGFQIVLADDGSDESFYDAAEKLFESFKFTNYVLVKNTVNQGTVLNCLSGVRECKGRYVKTISPGDYFASDDALIQWYTFIEQKKAEWSFCDAFYYRMNCSNQIEFVEQYANPQDVKPYLKDEVQKYRWNYVVMNDICLGAAILCKKSVLEKYLELIEGKVIYAEDNIYRLMMTDGLKVVYYPKALIMYEYGEGISTSENDIWSKRLRADFDETTKMVLEHCCKYEHLDKRYKYFVHVERTSNQYIKKLKRVFLSGYIIHRIKLLFYKRKTPTHLI